MIYLNFAYVLWQKDGYFYVMESSLSDEYAKQARMISPLVSTRITWCISFAYYMGKDKSGILTLSQAESPGTTNQTIWQLTGPGNGTWIKAEIDIKPTSNNFYRVTKMLLNDNLC